MIVVVVVVVVVDDDDEVGAVHGFVFEWDILTRLTTSRRLAVSD